MTNLNNRIKEAFDHIHADSDLKANTADFVCGKTNQYQKSHFFSYKRFAAVVVCLLLVLVGQKGYSVYFTPVSTISIDVNPSIEFSVNQFDKVIDVASYNEDGEILVSSMNVRFLDYKKALNLLLQNENMASYLTQDQTVIITVFGASDQKNDEMLASLATYTASYENVHCSSGHSEEVTEAHSFGLSCGKYRAFLELQALDPSITVEDIRELSMRQIQDMIIERSNGAADAFEEDETTQENETTQDNATTQDCETTPNNETTQNNETVQNNDHGHGNHHGHRNRQH